MRTFSYFFIKIAYPIREYKLSFLRRISCLLKLVLTDSAASVVLVARIAVMDPEVELVAINSTSDAEGTARLFEYDSTHGIFKGDVSYEDGVLIVDGPAHHPL